MDCAELVGAVTCSRSLPACLLPRFMLLEMGQVPPIRPRDSTSTPTQLKPEPWSARQEKRGNLSVSWAWDTHWGLTEREAPRALGKMLRGSGKMLTPIVMNCLCIIRNPLTASGQQLRVPCAGQGWDNRMARGLGITQQAGFRRGCAGSLKWHNVRSHLGTQSSISRCSCNSARGKVKTSHSGTIDPALKIKHCRRGIAENRSVLQSNKLPIYTTVGFI